LLIGKLKDSKMYFHPKAKGAGIKGSLRPGELTKCTGVIDMISTGEQQWIAMWSS